MQWLVLILIFPLTVTGCAQARPPQGMDLSLPSEEWREPDAGSSGLDGLIVDGHVRARGPMGVISVPGTLSFREGLLVWTARETDDRGRYQIRPIAGGTAFRAEHQLENGERTVWTGWHDGYDLHDVSAMWHRVEGDFVHDLLLPDTVILDFTPAE